MIELCVIECVHSPDAQKETHTQTEWLQYFARSECSALRKVPLDSPDDLNTKWLLLAGLTV